jgi:heptosyltransferase III
VQNFYEAIRGAYPDNLPVLSANHLAPRLTLPVTDPVLEAKEAGRPTLALVLGVGGKRPNRAWPISHYQALVVQLLTSHPSWDIDLIGGPEDAPLATALLANLPQAFAPNVTNYCGQLALLATAQQLAQADCVVGGDTGPMHLAAALGRPCVGLFAPTHVARTGLLSTIGPANVRHLTPPSTLPCWPCEKPVCGGQGDSPCIGDISPPLVAEAIMMLLKALDLSTVTIH